MLSGPVLLTPRLLFWFAGVLLAGGLLGTTPALADLRVCNQTGNQVSIALGYRAERGWQSEGWWVAPPGQCAIVFQGDLNGVNSSYFYIFAADDIGGGAWDGSFFMCTRDDSFTIVRAAEDCLARGYERTGFFEVDTGDRSDWTLQLVRAAAGEAEGGADQVVPLEQAVPSPPDGASPDGVEVVP